MHCSATLRARCSVTAAARAAWPTEEVDLVTTIQELIENGEARGKADAIRRILERRFGPTRHDGAEAADPG